METLIKDENIDNKIIDYMQSKVKNINITDFKNIKEYYQYLNNLPFKKTHHPLLIDYAWLYQNIENIFLNQQTNYQQYQGFEEYYLFFKVLTNKYSLEKDYQDYFKNKDNIFYLDYLKLKWGSFISKFINFFSLAPDDVLKKLFAQEDFRGYLIKYIELFEEYIIDSSSSFIRLFLEYYPFYYNKTNTIFNLLKYPKIILPLKEYLNPTLIKDISHNIDTDKFYYNLYLLGSNYINIPYIEEHKKFIDKQINGIKNNILPYFQNNYEESNDYCYYNNNKYDDIIFKDIEDLPMPKKEYYQKLSKYYLIELVISSLFECTYYNLLVDMETLVRSGKEITGLSYYEFLINIENKSLDDIRDFYQKGKKINLKEMFYDDWNKQKDYLIQELNSNIIDLKTLEIKDKDGISYYDISNIDKYLIVHTEVSVQINTIDFLNILNNLKKIMMDGNIECISLSILDQNHQETYGRNSNLTFIYGPLDAKRVGTIYYEDAYTEGVQEVEFANENFIRRIYTLEDLMKETKGFNELVYAINGEAFYPIGILVKEVTPLIYQASVILDLPIIYRKPKEYKERKENKCNIERIRSRYNNLNRYLQI